MSETPRILACNRGAHVQTARDEAGNDQAATLPECLPTAVVLRARATTAALAIANAKRRPRKG